MDILLCQNRTSAGVTHNINNESGFSKPICTIPGPKPEWNAAIISVIRYASVTDLYCIRFLVVYRSVHNFGPD